MSNVNLSVIFLEPVAMFVTVAVAPSVWPVIVSLFVNILLLVVINVIGFVGLITTAVQSLTAPFTISPLLNAPETPVIVADGSVGAALESSES